MDINTIENQVNNFTDTFFANEKFLVDTSSSFIEKHDLYTPKENYTIVVDFLFSVIKNFRVLDSKFMGDTLQKLYIDVQSLQAKYLSLQTKTKDTEEVFNKHFIPSLPTMNLLRQEIKNIKQVTSDDKIMLETLIKDYKALKNIYAEVFNEIFRDEKKYYLSSLLSILNSRAYYLDKVLWVQADKSLVITKHFKILNIEDKLNTKTYLLYTTGLMRPYTAEYKYLQSCLRIYK